MHKRRYFISLTFVFLPNYLFGQDFVGAVSAKKKNPVTTCSNITTEDVEQTARVKVINQHTSNTRPLCLPTVGAPLHPSVRPSTPFRFSILLIKRRGNRRPAQTQPPVWVGSMASAKEEESWWTDVACCCLPRRFSALSNRAYQNKVLKSFSHAGWSEPLSFGLMCRPNKPVLMQAWAKMSPPHKQQQQKHVWCFYECSGSKRSRRGTANAATRCVSRQRPVRRQLL